MPCQTGRELWEVFARLPVHQHREALIINAMLYDAFICHAYEDKESFVRPLAAALRAQHVEVWYDEFSLRIGDSLRRSIDRGLMQSRFGIVVLSPHFFRKQWSQWELDGLVARQNAADANVILPIWRDVRSEDVLNYSAPLADKLALSADAGLDEVVRGLLTVLQPEGSTLIIARDHLIEHGCVPPVVTDDWWLDVAAASESNDMEGGFQEPMGWGRWGFPLPPKSQVPAERGLRMAWAAMQMDWQREADFLPITQVTRPEQVLEFIESEPGLSEACHQHVDYLIAYAPQLILRGKGGEFEDAVEALYRRSQAQRNMTVAAHTRFRAGLTVDGRPPTCEEEFALRHPEFGGYTPAVVACGFTQGNAVANGPPVRYYDPIDHLAWLLSDASLWLPKQVRDFLTRGMVEWGVWINGTRASAYLRDHGFRDESFSGASAELSEVLSPATWTPSGRVLEDLAHRLGFSSQWIGLSEDGQVLASRLLIPELLALYFKARGAPSGV